MAGSYRASPVDMMAFHAPADTTKQDTTKVVESREIKIVLDQISRMDSLIMKKRAKLASDSIK